jgi:hypothetical protein
MKAIERLYKYIDFKGYKPTNFEKEMGLSSGYLSVQKKRNADIGETVINKINDYCQDLSIEWLLTGSGEMLRNTEKTEENIASVAISPDVFEQISLLTQTILSQQQTIDYLCKKITGDTAVAV